MSLNFNWSVNLVWIIFLLIGEIHIVNECKVDEEFRNINMKTSHDGLFQFKAVDISQEILDQVGEIRVILGGTCALNGRKDEDTKKKIIEM